MNNQVTTLPKSNIQTKPSALATMAARMAVEPAKLFSTLKSTVFKNATDDELLALVVVANEYGLSPFLKEIYAFPAKGGGITPIVSVDGWNKMLIRHPDFDGIEFDMQDDANGNPYSCTATIYVKGRSKPVKITEYLDECKRNSEPWNNMPRRMLRNRTLCQASRVAFGFSGIHNEDEIEAITVEATVLPPKQITVESGIVTQSKPVEVSAETSIPPQVTLANTIVEAGYNFDQFKAAAATGFIKDTESLTSFEDVTTEDAIRLNKAIKAVISKIKTLN